MAKTSKGMDGLEYGGAVSVRRRRMIGEDRTICEAHRKPTAA